LRALKNPTLSDYTDFPALKCFYSGIPPANEMSVREKDDYSD